MKSRRNDGDSRPGMSMGGRVMVCVTALVMMAGTTAILSSGPGPGSTNPAGGGVAMSSLGAGDPAKEDIHAGGRLVAIEEAAAASGPGCETGPGGDFDGDGIPDDIEPIEGTNPCVKDNDVFNSARLFVMQQYRDFLDREGDAGGITFWTNAINGQTVTRAQVIEFFFNSAEFQDDTAPVTRLYFAFFLRIPDYGGLTFWVAQRKNGSSLESIAEAFAQSTEFILTYGHLNNEEFVTLVYQNVLDREPDPGGLAYWTDQLNTGALTRGGVMLNFSESQEYRDRIQNPVYVTMIHVGMLRRSPDQSGFDIWVGHLDGGGSGLGLIQNLLSSQEYHDRFLE